jgi:hypothetical protein
MKTGRNYLRLVSFCSSIILAYKPHPKEKGRRENFAAPGKTSS